MKKSEIDSVKQIYELFSQIDSLWVELPEETKDEFNELLAEHYTLAHCIRWGSQACEEIINYYEKEQSDKIEVLLVKPLCEPEVVTIVNELKSIQKIVQGYIECIYPEENVAFIMDEEGKLKGLDGNRKLENGDIIAGNFIICGIDNNTGEFISLPEDKIEMYMKKYEEIEFYNQNDVENSILIEVIPQVLNPLDTNKTGGMFTYVKLNCNDLSSNFLISGMVDAEDVFECEAFSEFANELNDGYEIQIFTDTYTYGNGEIEDATLVELSYISNNLEKLLESGYLNKCRESNCTEYVEHDNER
jgi:hypothetical protein